MDATKSRFAGILEKIEKTLEDALPASANSAWISDSFGTLPQSVIPSHFDNLIAPNKNLIAHGGKRWRPTFMALCYYQAREKKSASTEYLSEQQMYSLAPLVECVHTASLIHDDIEDGADLRRGEPAAHITYGTDTAINAASWLYFEAPVCIDKCDISEHGKLLLYRTYTRELRRLHLGQAMDIHWHRNPSVFPAEDEYLAMVKNKTGTLASLAAKIGGLAGGLSEPEADALGETAANIGMGFQIIDDVVNLTTGNVGKKRGDDIVEGKKSLPVILHIKENPGDRQKIAECMERAAKDGIDSPAVERCIEILESRGAIKNAAEKGIALIEKNAGALQSEDIKSLFMSMVPPDFLRD